MAEATYEEIAKDETLLAKALARALRCGGDFADLYLESTTVNTFFLEDGKVERAKKGYERGAGIRVLKGDSTFYAFTDDISAKGLLEAASNVAAACGTGSRSVVIDLRKNAAESHPVLLWPETVSGERKVDLLLRSDRAARKVDPHVVQVAVSYSDTTRHITIARSDGFMASDVRCYVRLGVNVVASRNGEIQTGAKTFGKLMGMELFDQVSPELAGEAAARQAVTNLFASPAPSGRMPVVITNGWGGVLFHEACGHGLEADEVQKAASVFAGKIGQQVASPLVSAVDDATLNNGWGSFVWDDEGQPAERTLLIDGGKLVGYMYDLRASKKEGKRSTGNGRRESYQNPPIPRMSNTFICPGDLDPSEIISGTSYGFFAKDFRGGQVNPTTGDFVFSVSEGYIIRNGEISEPVRGATLIGNGPQVLMLIDAVGNDLDLGPGMCGKDGQSVPVACGQPTIRVRELTVGGTKVDRKQ